MTIGSNTSGHLFDTTFNTDGVLYSAANGVITSTSVGSATQVLTSNGSGSAPTFQAATVGVSGPGSSTSNGVATWNGTGGTALLSPPSPLISSAGVLTNSNQTQFYAYCSTTKTNVTGNSVTYTVVFDSTVNNVGSGYNTSTGVFTAPITGTYIFTSTIIFSGATTGTTLIIASLGSVFSQRLSQESPLSGSIFSNTWQVPMTAADTMAVQVFSDNTGQTVSIFGEALSSASLSTISTFTGFLLG